MNNNNIFQYETKIWNTADLLRGSVTILRLFDKETPSSGQVLPIN